MNAYQMETLSYMIVPHEWWSSRANLERPSRCTCIRIWISKNSRSRWLRSNSSHWSVATRSSSESSWLASPFSSMPKTATCSSLEIQLLEWGILRIRRGSSKSDRNIESSKESKILIRTYTYRTPVLGKALSFIQGLNLETYIELSRESRALDLHSMASFKMIRNSVMDNLLLNMNMITVRWQRPKGLL